VEVSNVNEIKGTCHEVPNWHLNHVKHFQKTLQAYLGQVMNHNYLIWMLSLLLIEQRCFSQSHTPIPPKLSHVAPPTMITLSMQVGAILEQFKLYILGSCAIMNAKGHVWMLGGMSMMWGC